MADIKQCHDTIADEFAGKAGVNGVGDVDDQNNQITISVTDPDSPEFKAIEPDIRDRAKEFEVEVVIEKRSPFRFAGL